MPTHTFKNSSGVCREIIVPMGTMTLEADGRVWNRLKEPEGFQIATPIDDSQQARMKRGYYRHEQEGWTSQYSKTQVKKAWDL